MTAHDADIANARPHPGVAPSGHPEPRAGRTHWSQLALVSAAEFVVWTGFGAIMPYLPIFLQEEAHSSLFLIGVIAAAFYLGTLAFSSPLGWLSDLVGRKPVIVAGTFLYALAMFLFTRTAEPWWFVLFRLLEGVGTAAVAPAATALVADISRPGDRSKAYGVLTSAQFGGLIVGPALAPPLYHLAGGGRAGFYAIFYFGAALTAATAFAVAAVLREPSATAQRRAQREGRAAAAAAGAAAPGQAAAGREVAADTARSTPRRAWREVLTPPIVAFLVVAFTSHFAMGGFEVIWSIWLKHLGASMTYISLTWIVFSVPMLLSFAGGILADRYSRFTLMFTGYTVSALAWIVYGTTRDLGLFLAVNAVEGLAVAFSYPPKQAFLVQVSPPQWLGTVTGLEATAMQLAGMLGTFATPVLYERMSGYVLALGGVVNLVGLAVAAPVLYRAWRRVAPPRAG